MSAAWGGVEMAGFQRQKPVRAERGPSVLSVGFATFIWHGQSWIEEVQR
ncbi:hypothetical protein [Kibdelosporangium philippinense]